MLFDISSVDTRHAAEEGRAIPVLHPTKGTPTGIKITLIGADSKSWQDRELQARRDHLEKMQTGQQQVRTPEQIDAEHLADLVFATKGWEGMAIGSEEIPYSPENAKRIYSEHKWIANQVHKAIFNRANFLPGSANS